MRVAAIVLALLVVVVAAAAFFAVMYLTAMPGPRRGVAQVRPDLALARRLRAHVTHLASNIGVRRRGVNGSLDASADYVLAEFRDAGLTPRELRYEAGGNTFRNVEAELTGTDSDAPVLIVGAHYDSVPGSPGADDNASGVAGLIEIGRLLAQQPLCRSVHLVAFANEEDPFWMTAASGSYTYARQARARGAAIRFMISLEMLGYYVSSPGSQRYPGIIGWRYPDTGNFIAVVGKLAERALVGRLVGTLRAASPIDAHGMAAPVRWVPDIRRSDHASFWHFGYPAVMLTDTANFRYPFYHTARDTPDRLDYEGMAGVVAAIAELLRVEAGCGRPR